MENMNLSDKSREALKSETWQELREDMKEEIVSEYLKNGYADEESPIDEAPNETEKAAEDFKEKACDKLREELKKADDKQFADPVIGYLLKRCGEDNGLAQDVMQKHKT